MPTFLLRLRLTAYFSSYYSSSSSSSSELLVSNNLSILQAGVFSRDSKLLAVKRLLVKYYAPRRLFALVKPVQFRLIRYKRVTSWWRVVTPTGPLSERWAGEPHLGFIGADFRFLWSNLARLIRYSHGTCQEFPPTRPRLPSDGSFEWFLQLVVIFPKRGNIFAFI